MHFEKQNNYTMDWFTLSAPLVRHWEYQLHLKMQNILYKLKAFSLSYKFTSAPARLLVELGSTEDSPANSCSLVFKQISLGI